MARRTPTADAAKRLNAKRAGTAAKASKGATGAQVKVGRKTARARQTAAGKPAGGRKGRKTVAKAAGTRAPGGAAGPRGRATAKPAKAARAAPVRLMVSAAFKTIALAAEPPRDNDPVHLDPAFRAKLDAVLARLSAAGRPFRFVEGFRTVERQQWLFGSGRPAVVPFGRPGPIVTKADGVTKPSNHQGTGVPGSGKAADCYPLRDGRVFIPPNTDPLWAAYAAAAVAEGLVAGHNFPSFKDSPHCELR